MKLPSIFRPASSALAATLLGFSLSPSASAVDSYATDPVGFITVTTGSGGSVSSPKLTPVAPTMVQPVAWQGLAATITPTTITSGTAATGWTVDKFNGANGAHYVEIVSGTNAGAWTDIVTTGINSLTVADDLTSFSTGNVSIRIRKQMTLASFLGANNSAGLAPGTEVAVADEVYVYDGPNKSIYFYYDGSEGGDAGWYDPSFTLSNDVVIAPSQGVFIKRKSAIGVSFKVMGSVKTGATFVPIVQNNNVVPAVNAAGLTLDDSNLYTGNPNTGLLGGDEIANADEVTIYTTTSQKVYFYYNGDPQGAGWYDPSFNAAGSVVIAPGSSFAIKRKPPGVPFNWKLPGPTLQ